MYYSRVTKKGQTTIPSVYRKKFGIEEGDRVVFEETERGLVLKPAVDIEDAAGSMSRYGEARELLEQVFEARRKSFR